ncbi:hypothetical protein COI_1237 [Mannheimia haemolytica serotype A2 str. OVINE]|nr:hypothetical protein COI_1237 [Mannheimia haemolytica serotype A2 str. OVINE]
MVILGIKKAVWWTAWNCGYINPKFGGVKPQYLFLRSASKK